MPTPANITQGETDRLVQAAQIAVGMSADVVSDRDREFCASIIRQSRRPGFWPSDGQAKWLAAIADRMHRTVEDDDVVESLNAGRTI